MTANQVSYWRNVETQRANKAGEKLRGEELALATKKYKTEKALGITNAITGGIKNVASAFKDVMSPVSDATKLVESAGILGLL